MPTCNKKTDEVWKVSKILIKNNQSKEAIKIVNQPEKNNQQVIEEARIQQ